MNDKVQYIWALLRLTIGLIFLWAFFDKLFGLGFVTEPEKAWLAGNAPTYGFLKFATKGPFAPFYQSIAGNPIVDWLFMLGLLGIGIAFTFGIVMKLGGYSAAIMLILMYTAVLPPEHHPFLDEHIVYALVVLGFAYSDIGRKLSISQWWSQTKLAARLPILK